jgi:PiT family inorganic phosphate transporter
MTLLLTVILVALVFEYINGFHDTANSIATVVSTKVLTPRQAIVLASTMNLFGALVGTAVASTIAKGLVDVKFVSSQTIICALLGGIIWNLLTWWFGLPSSSSHALIGGLCGATLASANGNWDALIWAQPAADHWWKSSGLLYKVVIPMVSSPVIGLLLGLFFMSVLYALVGKWRPRTVGLVFGKLQLVSAGYMGFSHGSNDAQKTMGIITLALVAATKDGALASAPDWIRDWLTTSPGTPADHLSPISWFVTQLPTWLQFGYEIPKVNATAQHVPMWVTLACAVTMCAGTAAGGWRIIRTMGHKLVKLQPIHGFAAETTGATVLMVAAKLGMPVSTTHAITTSIMGVGAAKRFGAVKLNMVQRILWAWVLTLPATGLLGYLFFKLTRALAG